MNEKKIEIIASESELKALEQVKELSTDKSPAFNIYLMIIRDKELSQNLFTFFKKLQDALDG